MHFNSLRLFRIVPVFHLVCCGALLLFTHSDLSAQTSPEGKPGSRVSGDLEIEDTKTKPQSPHLLGQGLAIQWVGTVKGSIDAGGTAVPAALDDAAATYLSTLYLYCIYKLGTCPFILDTVLEADVLADRGRSANECPSMSRFWKVWLSNDLEQRAKYLLSVGNGTAVANFNAVERPKYVKCKDTVGRLLGGESAAVRYASGGAISQAAQRTLRFLKEVQSKNIDIFSAVGVSVDSGKPSHSKER